MEFGLAIRSGRKTAVRGYVEQEKYRLTEEATVTMLQTTVGVRP